MGEPESLSCFFILPSLHFVHQKLSGKEKCLLPKGFLSPLFDKPGKNDWRFMKK